MASQPTNSGHESATGAGATVATGSSSFPASKSQAGTRGDSADVRIPDAKGKSRDADQSRRIAGWKARLDPERMPAHIAIIMDGNGRWAKQHRLPSRLLGHQRGYRTLQDIVRDAADLNIGVLTVYVFSNENWRRPKMETDGLMSLIEHATRTELRELHENGIRMRFMGRRSDLPSSLQREMNAAEALTANNTGLTLNLALNYGGRAEIVDAAKAMAEEVRAGRMSPDEITEESFAKFTYAPDLPDPDLLIRTAGDLRISNFLLWGIAYAELWVTPTFWPDFTTEHLVQAIEDFQSRIRKFGAVVNVP